MAKCKCGENWLWDWEQDCYRYPDGSRIEEIQLLCTEKGMELELFVYKCKCGKVNSALYNDDARGSSCCSIRAWQNVDLETDGNSWKDCHLICENKICLEN